MNKHGHGKLYFGIKDDGTVVGQTLGRNTIKKVTQMIVDNIEPRIYPKIMRKKIKSKECVEVEFQGLNSPYFAYGRAYIRVGEPDKQMTAKEIKGKGHSILRNPLIAETMYRSEDIEKWASGIKRIYDECEASRVKVDFNRVKTGFAVLFHRPKWEEGEGLEPDGQKSNMKSREKTIQKTTRKTTRKQDAILSYLKEHPVAGREEIAKKIKDITESGVKYNLKVLREKGLLKRVGPDKGGHWEVID